MNTPDVAQFLIEYFSGIEKGDFYEEPVEGEYPGLVVAKLNWI